MAFIPTVGSNAAKGTALPLQQARDKFGGEVGREWGTRTTRIVYAEGSNGWRASVPEHDTVHPSADWLKVRSYECSQEQRAPLSAVLVVRYEQDSFSATYPTPDLPEDEVIEDGGVLEIDIRRHPDFETIVVGAGWPQGGEGSLRNFYDWNNQRIFSEETVPETVQDSQGAEVAPVLAGETVPESIRGVSGYFVGTGQVTVIEYSYTEPDSVLTEAGKRGVPVGYGGLLNNWLLMSGTKQEVGAYWARRLSYQYSAREISDIIYPEEFTA